MPSTPLTPLVKKLLITFGVLFVVELLAARALGVDMTALLALSSTDPIGVSLLWKVFTHVVAFDVSPNGVFMLLLSMLFFHWMGSPIELRFGAKVLATILAIATVASGVAVLLVGFVLPGAAFGTGPLFLALIAAFGVTMPPNAQIRLFGIIPMSNKTLIIGVLVLTLIQGIAAANYAGMLGDYAAMGATWMYFKNLMAPPKRPRRDSSPRPKKRRRNDLGFKVIDGGRTTDNDDDDERPRYLN